MKRNGRWLINHYHVTNPNDYTELMQNQMLRGTGTGVVVVPAKWAYRALAGRH